MAFAPARGGRYGYAQGKPVTSAEAKENAALVTKPSADALVRSQIDPDQYLALLRSIYRKVDILTKPLIATNAGAISALPEQKNRTYLFIQNQSGVNQIVINFGQPPGATGLVPVNGLVISPFPGFYEPLAVPAQELWISASAPNTPVFILYATN